jgi:hypothetical protein
MRTWQLRVYEIYRDAAAELDIKRLRDAGLEFIDRLGHDDPPPIDWTPSTARAIRSLYPDISDQEVRVSAKLARRYRKAQAQADRAKMALALASNELMAAMGEGKYAVAKIDGQQVRIATRTQYPRKSIDSKSLRAKLPKTADRFTKTTPVDALYPGTWAKPERTES